MERRRYLGALAGVVASTAVAGCLQGEAVLHENRITATTPTKEWTVDLEEGNNMRLEVNKEDDDGVATVTGYVHRSDTGEEVVATSASSGHERFDVPATGTYVVSIEVNGGTGEIILRDMN
ncbi:hypothetical protein [Halorubellus sp. PRR65]|uniref:hypothetical protein n=1 Tax=Halorubellus sp. PRR65 TaxID=3098148 RepID=UPI002B25C9C0|nr:hypothetical protein [Halorubellus sp. PRR65]